MEIYEINAAMQYSYYAHKDSWEQARLVSYMIAQTNSKNRLNVTDIVKFKWDEEDKDEQVTTEEINRLIEKSKQYIINE